MSKTIKVRVKATVIKEYEIEIPEHITDEELQQDYADEQACEMFICDNDEYEVKYSQTSEIIS